MKKLYLFLSRTDSIASKIVHFFTKTTYTHASLSFDEDCVYLYSSGRKKGFKMFPAGPTRESLYRGFFGRDDHTPCVLYSFDVPDEVFDKARAEIEYFMEHNDDYKFSAWGIIACKFGIRWERKNKYFCSQFVAEILTRSGAVSLGKPSCLVHPRDYQKIEGLTKHFEGTVGQLRHKIEAKKEAVTT